MVEGWWEVRGGWRSSGYGGDPGDVGRTVLCGENSSCSGVWEMLGVW